MVCCSDKFYLQHLAAKARDHMQYLAPTQKLHANPTSPSPDNLHYLRTDKLGVSPDSRTGDASLCVSLTNLDKIRVQKGRSKRTGRTKNVAEFLPSLNLLPYLLCMNGRFCICSVYGDL